MRFICKVCMYGNFVSYGNLGNALFMREKRCLIKDGFNWVPICKLIDVLMT